MEGLSISSSEPITPQRALERLFTEQELQLDAWFACTSIDFMILKAQELDDLAFLLDSLTGHFGAYLRVEQVEQAEVEEGQEKKAEKADKPKKHFKEGKKETEEKEEKQEEEEDVEVAAEEEEGAHSDEIFFVHFEHGAIPTGIRLDSSNGRIVELCFGTPQEGVFQIGFEEAIAKLQSWAGEQSLLISMLVLENGSTLAALNPEQPLGVGSAFKLAVLCALKRQIDAGERSWSHVVELLPEWKSFPSGILQNWVDGSPLTLNTLATLMISISDNTAADSLIHLVGKEAVEQFAWRNRPFLTTREFFLLKHPQNENLLEAYRKFGQDEIQRRREFLEEVVDSSPLPDEFPEWTSPKALDVEFFFTARELCELMDKVCEVRLMEVNTGGLVDRSEWAHMAFKGGSEPGVLNLTVWLEAHNGRRFHVVLTANDAEAPLNETKLILVVLRVIETLKSLA